MRNWNDVLNLRVFKTIRMKVGSKFMLEQAGVTAPVEVDLAELAAIDAIAAADLAKIDGITNGTAAAGKAIVLDANKDAISIRDLTMRTAIVEAITGNDSSLGITGQAAAQGGVVATVGGASSTSANAGGAAQVTGGAPGATGVGGAATVAAAAGGATSGVGGAATLTGGAGTAGNSAGGVATATGGAGQGTANGGAASVVGGASGAGATGNGGAASITGGAAASTNGQGGDVTMTPGVGTGTGFAGNIVEVSALKLVKQAAPTALTTSATLTAAQILVGLLTANQGAAAAASYTLPTGTAFEAGFSSFATDQAFDFSLINISANAAEDVDILTNTGWTLVGSMAVQSNDAITSKSVGRFRARRTAANTFTLYRIA